uniref:Uncharacterized protein n=1 Tax=Anguilla anguilla TaxID=7936 RepID=A0A0E9QB04_ANGAN
MAFYIRYFLKLLENQSSYFYFHRTTSCNKDYMYFHMIYSSL